MKNNKKKNVMRRIVPAAGMLIVSAAMLASSTYAWFTMNKEVQVTGMQLKTKVGSNLLISPNNANGTYLGDKLVEGRSALLEPVSSNTGKTGTFYYTVDADELGKKAHAETTYKKYVEATGNNATCAGAGKYYYDSAFNSAYGIDSPGATTQYDTAYGYVDYVFYLKATSTNAGQEIRMTQCDLNYTYSGTDPGDNAWRVALFASELPDGTAGKGNTGDGYQVGILDPAASAAKCILKTSSASYFTTGKAVADTVDTTNTLGDVTTGSAVVHTFANAGETKYFKVLVRVWLEGEDTSCTSATYSQLDNNWALDLDFELTEGNDNTKTAATAITKNTWEPTITTTQTGPSTPVEVVTTTTS